MNLGLFDFRKRGVALLALVFLVFLWIPAAHAQSCDETQLAEVKAEFQRLKDLQRKDTSAVSAEEFRLAAQRLIETSESCYQAKYGGPDAGHPIDDGGLSGPQNKIRPRHNLEGTKWGAGSPFLMSGDNIDASGPRIAGGEVTYSFMSAGVDLGNDGGSGASCAPNCVNSPITVFSQATNGGDSFFPQCILEQITDAFAAWSSVANITFRNVADSGLAFDAPGAGGEIRIGFHPIDGTGGTLAHAFFPPPVAGLDSGAGDIHFDFELWTCTPSITTVDLGIVALHQIGHAIGLRHEATDLAIMNAGYNPALDFGPLPDDMFGASEIYGTASGAATSFFGSVGFGTDAPQTELHVVDPTGDAQLTMVGAGGFTGFVFTNTNAVTGNTWFVTHGNGGALAIDDEKPGEPMGTHQEFRVFENGDVKITGQITTTGSCVAGCDRVFSPEYELESIEEHAQYMWENSHLEGVGPTPEDAPFNLTTKMGGVLNELEKAHIYLEQLHKRLLDTEAQLRANEDERNALLARLSRLESLLEEKQQEGSPKKDD